MSQFARIAIGGLLTLLVCADCVAVAYTAWQDDWEVDGEVRTGSVDARWIAGTCGNVPDEQAIASVEMGTRNGGEELTLKISNAYPELNIQCSAFIANTGTAPLQIHELSHVIPRGTRNLEMSVSEAGGANGVLVPCERNVSWGDNRSSLPDDCQAEIIIEVTVKDDNDREIDIGFTVEIGLPTDWGR